MTTRTRMSAVERREQVLDAALAEFARRGFHGTSTDDVARRAGISQPYIFRLFPSKRALFLATVERCFAETGEIFRQAASTADERDPGARLAAMGLAYRELLRDRDRLLMQMHAYAATGEEDVRERVRDLFGELYRLVEDVSHASSTDVQTFFAHGMLLNVAATLDLPALFGDEPWVARCLRDGATEA